eukprot:6599516-Pyramimonas_sp.AAC.1
MIEAARYARSAIIFRKPRSLAARFMVLRSIARAVFRQDVQLALKLRRSHPLAREMVSVDAEQSEVTLSDPDRFTVMSNQVHSEVATRQRHRVARAAEQQTNEQKERRMRERLKRMAKVEQLWSPFDRRVYLTGVKDQEGNVHNTPSEINQQLKQHWGQVFTGQPFDAERARAFLREFPVQ